MAGNDRSPRFDPSRALRARLPETLLLRQYAGLSSANLFVAVTSFISLSVLARSLTVDEFARLVFARSATAAAFALLDPRLEDSLLRFLPIVRRDRSGGAASRLFERALLLDQGVNLAFAALGSAVLLSGMVPSGGIADPTLLVLATLQMATLGAVGTMSAGYALTEGLARWGMLQSASTVAFTAGSLTGLALSGSVGFLTGGIVAATLTTPALWFTTVRRTRRAYGPPSPARHPLPQGFFSFTLRAALNSSVLIGAESLPLVVVGLRADTSTLAAFRVALSPGRLANALVSPIASIVYPRASQASAARRSDAVAAEAIRFTRRVAPIAAVLFCIAAIAMPTAMAVAFGRSFRSASTAATVLLAAALVRGTVAWSKTLPLALGDATRRLIVSLSDVAGLVTAAALLADTDHAIGVAIAYVVIALVVSAYWLNYARRRSAERARVG